MKIANSKKFHDHWEKLQYKLEEVLSLAHAEGKDLRAEYQKALDLAILALDDLRVENIT